MNSCRAQDGNSLYSPLWGVEQFTGQHPKFAWETISTHLHWELYRQLSKQTVSSLGYSQLWPPLLKVS